MVNGERWLDKNGVYKEYNADQILTVNCDPELNQLNAQTPGFALAACGYVWLLNYQGSRYSTKHQFKN